MQQLHAVPNGWQPHPSAPGWYYNPMNPSEMGQLVAPAAAVASMPYAQPSHIAAAQQEAYGAVDTSLYSKPMPNSFGKREDYLYLDFPERSLSTGEAVSIVVRFLPPWSPSERMASIFRQQHRLPSKYHPRGIKTQIFMPDCYNTEGGPGNCPVCRVLDALATGSSDEDAASLVKEARARTSSIWQGYDVENVTQHCIQEKDQQGNVLGWFWKPGIFTASPKIYAALSQLMLKGDFTSPDAGANIIVTKRKTGPDKMNVDYSASFTMEGRSPIPNEYRGILSHLIDLNETRNFYPREEMDQIAEKIAQAFGIAEGGQAPAAAGGGWKQHPANPQYEYQPSTGQVRPIAAPALPPAPAPMAAPALPAVPASAAYPAPAPMMPPAAPVAAPPMPSMAMPPMPTAAPPPLAAPAPLPTAMPVMAPPPSVQLPPPPPAGAFPPPPGAALPPPVADRPLPPPGAPGGFPVAPPAIPTGVSPALGMPGALPAMPALPPPPVGAPGAAMSPGALEQALVGGGKVPF